MPTLFLAGATGYTGQALARLASAQGHRVIAHVRPASRDGELHARRFQEQGAEVDRSPWDAEAMSAALAHHAPDVVFGLLGTTRARGKAAASAGGPPETYESVDRDLTLLLLRAAEGLSRPPRFVYLSSLGAQAPRGNAYLRARFEVEQALRASALPWTIARPSFISGPDRPEDRPGERIGAQVADVALGALAMLGARSLQDRYGRMDADTLARGLLRVALDPAMAGRVLEAADLR